MAVAERDTKDSLLYKHVAWNKIYCSCCADIKEFTAERLSEDPNNGPALDIVCVDCKYIIATLFTDKR